MPWMRLDYRPGITKDRTDYSSYGTWVDGSLVRFRDGLPESWLGWQQAFDGFTFEGMARSLFRFSDLVGFSWLGLGTNYRYYVLSDDVNYDVTPVIREVTLGSNPLSTTIGSNVIEVSDVAHGAVQGSYVILSGATATGGIPAGEINAEHKISSIVSDDAYEITVTTNATSTTTGGGAAVLAQYLFLAGSESQIEGGGWGALGWGDEEWGGDPALAIGDRMGIWTQTNWGEDLVANANDGPIFYWDRTNPSDRMVNILDLPGADGNAPSVSEFVIGSHRDRHLLAFGVTEYGSGNYAPMTFRWCSQENILNWNEADTTGTAGSLPLSHGSRFLAGIATSREILVWSDTSLYSIQYIGAPLIFNAEIIEAKSDIVGLKAAASTEDAVYWMGRSGFYMYNGRVVPIKSAIWEYVTARLDFSQAQKIYTASNRRYSEVIWFYPSTDGNGENDSYVAYDYSNNLWSIGALPRTAWLDGDSLNTPLAASPDAHMYFHEIGANDGSTDPVTAINAYVEAAPLELSSEGSYDRGDRMMFIRRVLPDITFRNYGDNPITPTVNLVFKMMDKPGGGFTSSSSSQVRRSAIVPVEEFTEEVRVRLRGRSVSFRIEGASIDTVWRVGTTRIDVRTDGQR